MTDRWLVQEGSHLWNGLPGIDTDPENFLALATDTDGSGKRYFSIKENPTQVSEDPNKPIFTEMTINGKEIDIKPCSPPGQPLPMNTKFNIGIEHLLQEDYYRFQALNKYDIDFWLQTVNYRATPLRGRRLHMRILRMSTTWVGLRNDEQVYNISLVCRKLS